MTTAKARTGKVPNPSTAGGAAVKREPLGGKRAQVREVLDHVNAGAQQPGMSRALLHRTPCRRC